MDRGRSIERLFGVPRALVGMVHVAALPGAPESRLPVDAIAESAAAEARLLGSAGFHGVLLENMHDRPYVKEAASPETVAAMTAVVREVRRSVAVPLGVQLLAGANREALAVAHAAGAAFIRAEGFVFAHVADEGLIQGCAGELLRYRRAIGAEAIAVWADVKKKHAAHALTSDLDLVETAHAAELFLADAVVVTGVATGRAADPLEVAAVSRAVGIPTVVGSGLGAETLHRYAAADALIVGSALKRDGLWSNPPEPARLEAVARAFSRLSPPEPLDPPA